jgi:hypothetical protein
MIKDKDVAKDLRLLADLIEDGKVQLSGYDVRRKIEEQEPEFTDFDSEPKAEMKDTGRRILAVRFIE